MAGETTSPNMNLVLPGVGVTSGPQYATDLNSSLTIIDQHDHSTGSGVQITPSGLNISSDLTMGGNDLTNIRSLRLAIQSAALSASADLGCLYETGVDLYYNDGNGNQIRITQSGGIAGSPGSISNLSSPASASYVSGTTTFVWQSDTTTPANMDGGSFIFRNISANSKGLTLNPPAAMAANYSLTLPSLPASQKFMTLDNTGAITAPWAVDGSTIVVSSNVVKVPTQGITANEILNQTITATQIATGTISSGQITPGTITTANIGTGQITATLIETNVNLNGKNVKASSQNVVVSSNPATNGLMMMRSRFNQDGTLLDGEGITCVAGGTGSYTLTFAVTFTDTPAVVAIVGEGNYTSNNIAPFVVVRSITNSGCVLNIFTNAQTMTYASFHVIVIGQRP